MLYRRRRTDGSNNPIWYYDFQFNGKHYNGSTRESSKERARAVEDQRREEARGHSRVRDIPFGYTGDEKPAPLNLCDEYLRLQVQDLLRLDRRDPQASLQGVPPVPDRGPERGGVPGRSTRRREDGDGQPEPDRPEAHAPEGGRVGLRGEQPGDRVQERNRREFFLKADQADELLERTPEHIRPLVVAALHTGARRGDLLGLTWPDVDLDRCLVTFRDTKNGEDRSVRMRETLTATLRRLPSRLQGGPVFLSDDGKALEPADFRKDFDAAVKGAGLTGFRFHDLRHSAASFLVQAGVPLNTVREILGHKSITMTLRYAHLAPEHQEDAAKAMDRLHASRPAKEGAPAPPA